MNLPVTRKPSPYRVFRMSAGTSVLVLQTRCPETGEQVTQHELEAYRTRVKIDTPWHGLEKLPIGSRMLMTPRSARHMLAAGSITTMEEPGLIISREGTETAGRPDQSGTGATARKAAADACPRKR